MPTLKDIARDCGFSVSVVSRALNPKPDQQVAPETKKLIEESMRKLHYRRNHTASLLRRRVSSAIGVFLPKQHDSLIADLVIGISKVANEYDFQCNFYFGMNEADYLNFFRQVREMGNSGLLTYPFRTDHPMEKFNAALYEYQRAHGNVLIINTEAKEYPGIQTLGINNFAGGRLAARHLLEMGCRHFYHITTFGHSATQGPRGLGFGEEIKENGMKTELHRFSSVNFHEYNSTELRKFIQCLPSSSVGIFATNDYLALTLMLEIRRMGRGHEIGKNIRIIGFDNIPGGCYAQPPLSTLSQPFIELGEIAMRCLISAIIGIPQPQKKHLLPTLIARESSVGLKIH